MKYQQSIAAAPSAGCIDADSRRQDVTTADLYRAACCLLYTSDAADEMD